MIILKANRDEDLYIEWTTIADGPVWAGTRAALLRHLRSPDAEERISRADATGTSMFGSIYGFDHKGMICDQQWLPRHKLGDLARRLIADPTADVAAMGILEPITN